MSLDEQAHPPPVQRTARFDLAPPRRFVLPALLLLVVERPGYGYELQKMLDGFGLGHIDRPTIYRALNQLAADGLVRSELAHPSAGAARRVYTVTALGREVLDVWMSVVARERDCLTSVLDRFVGQVGTQLTSPASTLDIERCIAALTVDRPIWPDVHTPPVADHAHDGTEAGQPPECGMARTYAVDSTASRVAIDLRSTAGPVTFECTALHGSIVVATMEDRRISTIADITIDVAALRSRNALLDAELMRRVEARRFPTASLQLRASEPLPLVCTYRVSGNLTFHGSTRPIDGIVEAFTDIDGRLVVTGDHSFDVRDFAIPYPPTLLLRFSPDATIHLRIEADPVGDTLSWVLDEDRAAHADCLAPDHDGLAT